MSSRSGPPPADAPLGGVPGSSWRTGTPPRNHDRGPRRARAPRRTERFSFRARRDRGRRRAGVAMLDSAGWSLYGAILSVPVRGDPAGDSAVAAVRHLRSTTVPEAFANTGARVLVGGTTSG